MENLKYRRLDPLRLVDVVTEVKCSGCKKDYTPDKLDISLNCNLYYKMCKPCRKYIFENKIKNSGNK